jgi:hypothetical protein
MSIDRFTRRPEMKSITFILTLLVLALSVPSWLHAEGSQPTLKGIRVFRSGDNLGVEISADKSFEYTCTKMPQLLKVVIDLPRTEPGRPDTIYKFKAVNIARIWLEKKTVNDVKLTRVSVHLNEDADFTANIDPLDSTKLIVLFSKPAPAASGTVAAKPVAAKPVAAKPGPAKPGAPIPETPAAKTGGPNPVRPAAAVQTSAPEAPVSTSAALQATVPGASQPITLTGVRYGTDFIEITTSGALGEYKAFTLQQPGRLVLDLPGVHTTLRPAAVPSNKFGVSKARFGATEGRLRVVFETGTQPFPDYDLVKTGTGLRITLRGHQPAHQR